jgi:hypothetical protein
LQHSKYDIDGQFGYIEGAHDWIFLAQVSNQVYAKYLNFEQFQQSSKLD